MVGFAVKSVQRPSHTYNCYPMFASSNGRKHFIRMRGLRIPRLASDDRKIVCVLFLWP